MKKGDRVIEVDTTKPVMQVCGFKIKPSLTGYKQLEDVVTCEYVDEAGIKVKKDFKVSKLKQVPSSK